ncbi:cell division protein FtsL [Bacillus sp. 165]|uniref:cell division protein FtsL n=1 Tax=Bacillus sp. 165 TaxID=1529117 RepID=UPI001ADD53CC|nr:cell division protein FtsL [Bacillus sp. 165]MBO9130270.1 cell division protein FtsL [Bacillus sp. 165]
MSNLAVKLNKQERESRTPIQTQQQAVQRSGVTRFEKLLYVAFVAFLLYSSVTFISNKGRMFTVNSDVSKLERSILEQKKTNGELDVEVQRLSTYERIAEKAKEMGLEINENNVKGLK